MSRGWWEDRARLLTDGELAELAEVVEHEREVRAREETGEISPEPSAWTVSASSDIVRHA